MRNTTDNTITLDINEGIVKAVVNQIKSDMRGGRKYADYVEVYGVTRETVKDHAAALARLVTPETAQKKDGKRTKYGNAVQAAGNGLRAALVKDEDSAEDDTTDYLAKIIAAVDNGVTHNLNAADIAKAVTAHVESLLS